MRAFDQPGLGHVRAGERAFFIAEQLGLHQRFRQSGTVQADKGFVRARPGLHDGVGDQFLADTALAAQHHGGVGVGNGFDGLIHALHGEAAAHQSVKNRSRFHLLDDAAAFQFQGAFFDGAGQDNGQLGVIQREQQEFVSTGVDGVPENGALAGTSKRDQHDIVADATKLAEDFNGVGWPFADAIEIEQNGVQLRFLQDLSDLLRVLSGNGVEGCGQTRTDFRREGGIIGDYGNGKAV